MNDKPLNIVGWTFLGIVVVCAAGWWLSREPPIETLLADAHAAMERRDARQAAASLSRVLKREPLHPDALLASAAVAAEQQRFEEAVDFCRRVPPHADAVFVNARLMAGNICLDQLGRVSTAELVFREVLEVDQENLNANERLAYLMSLQTRSWDLIPFQIRQLRYSAKSATRIQLLMQGDLVYPDREMIQRLRTSDPQCAGLLLAESHLHYLAQNRVAALNSCQQALALQPELPEAHARIARILLHVGGAEDTEADLLRWKQALPSSAMEHPYVLYALGRLELLQQQDTAAATWFLKSLQLDPNSVNTNYQLGQCLIRLGRNEDARPFLERAALLERYQKQLPERGSSGPSETDNKEQFDQFLRAAFESRQMAESLGLIWETYAWSLIAAQAPEPPEWARETIRRLRPRLAELPIQRTRPEDNPALHFRLSDVVPQPDSIPPGGSSPERPAETVNNSDSDLPAAQASAPASDSIAFVDEAPATHLKFDYFNGFPAPRDAQVRPYDFTGGGVGVIDLNSDGWPDLYFPQGCRLSASGVPEPGPYRDQLFANHYGSRFVDVSHVALPADLDYSQGLSVGDYDNDGMPDLLIANLGTNRLLRNNGDGTFSDVSQIVQGDAAQWTTSCLICDLNHDGTPDLYFVNYLSGDVLTRICSDGEQRFGRCAPQDFPGAQDQLFLNQGDGRFLDASESSGISLPHGKGLGIIAADLNQDGRIDLFIANDGVPNFFLENTKDSSSAVRFSETAVQRGLAVNAEGQSEACMGIVAEDLNGNGRLDLFVTNFLEESNTLYERRTSDGLFADVTRLSGLAASSLSMLGFGTQSIDATLNGHPDLVITNGHIDSYPQQDVPYRMRPQYFRNRGGLRFEELPLPAPGPYFSASFLGRGMARVDWNRDGGDDLVITHLDQPAALLTNVSTDRGHFLALTLTGVSASRDAIGTVITVRTSSRILVRQLTAGDGYQASNERRLIFGLSSENEVQELVIDWTSGYRDTFVNLPADSDWVAIEGRTQLYSRIE